MPSPSRASAWPEVCPRCRVRLKKRFPGCPGCGEPLSPETFKARADAAVNQGLGFPGKMLHNDPEVEP